MFFHEYFANFDGDFGVLDESGTYNFVPNKRSSPPPPFSLVTPIFPLNVYEIFFWHSRPPNSAVSGRILLNFKILQALMHVIITWKYEKDWIKNSWEKVATLFSPL